MLYEEEETCGLAGNLHIIFKVFFELDENAQISRSEFMEYVQQVCNQEQYEFLECVLKTKPTGSILMGQNKITFLNSVLYGLRIRHCVVRVSKVTAANFDQVYKLVAKSELQEQYERIVQLRKQLSELQTNLANLTFQIMSADHERFRTLKKRNKQIEQVKRAVRRIERQKI